MRVRISCVLAVHYWVILCDIYAPMQLAVGHATLLEVFVLPFIHVFTCSVCIGWASYLRSGAL